MISQRETVHLAGDHDHGVSITHDLTESAFGKVTLRGPDRFAPPGCSYPEITCEVYKAGDLLSVHTICPKCGNGGWIDGRNKQISFDRDTGRLEIEKFKCPWEMSAERQHFGVGMCNLVLAYDGKVAKDA